MEQVRVDLKDDQKFAGEGLFSGQSRDHSVVNNNNQNNGNDLNKLAKKEEEESEHVEDEEVRLLAARLAPAFEQAHDLFQVPPEFQMGNDSNNMDPNNNQHSTEDALHIHNAMSGQEDDDLKRELSDLEHSEQLLRQELEQATFFSNFLASPSKSFVQEEEEEEEEEDPYPSIGEADVASNEFDTPEQNLELPPIDEETHEIKPTTNSIKKKQEKQRKEQQQRQQQRKPSTPPGERSRRSFQSTTSPPTGNVTPPSPASASSPILLMGRQPVAYHLQDHQQAIDLSIENGWYMANMNRFVLPSQLVNRNLSSQIFGLSDFCVACPENRLKTWYIGFTELTSLEKEKMVSVLPVRTSIVHIRPDVLCGAVMDAVVSATTMLIDTEPDHIKQHSVVRRQGGHLKLSVTTRADLEFLVDAQLCTHKSDQCERVLLVRIFHHSADATQSPRASASSPRSRRRRSFDQEEDEGAVPEACLYLREACSLVQRIEIEAANATVKNSRRQIKFRAAQSPSMSDRDAMQSAFAKHLQKTYKACPSTMEGNVTLPALNSHDWKLLRASWQWSEAVWDELESRSLTFTSLATTRFGAFPCLPTLDGHYCSQIRRYSRECMIAQLLKSATQLEEYARDSEYACANVIALLQKRYKEYGVDPPPLPTPIPLRAYELDYVNPQSTCPPWGQIVMEALNEVQVWVDEAGKNSQNHAIEQTLRGENLDSSISDSIDLACRSVACVLRAFQRQDDDEKGARLQRKNSQVMDRLSFMKKHQIVSVELLDTCTSDSALAAADELFAKTGIREVPLLKCNGVARSSTSTCIVTAHYVIFLTQLIPLLGSMMGHKVNVFSMKEIDFELLENSPLMLTALPTVIGVEKDGEEVFSFRPSGGGPRLKNFLDIIKSIACESKSLLSTA